MRDIGVWIVGLASKACAFLDAAVTLASYAVQPSKWGGILGRETNMTPLLTVLAWTLVLAFVQILLFDVARTGQYGLKWNMGARDETMPPLSPMAERLRRAQDNLYETLPLFIAAVLIAVAAGKENSITVLGAHIYLFGRIIYVPLYAYGVKNIRSLVWVGSTIGLGMVIVPLLLG